MPKITKRLVEAAKPQDKDYIICDDDLAGFAVRILPSGRRSYIVQYRIGNRYRRMSLGAHGVLTPEKARRMAFKVLGAVKDGEDPAGERSRARKACTVKELAERFDQEHISVRLKPGTATEYRRNLRRFILPALGRMKVADVTRADVAKFHHDLRHIPYQANRNLEVISKMFSMAEMWGMRPDGSNPRLHIKKYPEEKRERYLSQKELSDLGSVLNEAEEMGVDDIYAISAIRLLIFTGCRLNEIMSLKWTEVDFTNSCLRLSDSKTGARVVHLGPPALDLLKNLKRQPKNPWVICGKIPGTNRKEIQKFWQRIRKRAGIEDVRIHDLRHSFASNAVAQGMSLPMIGKLLGHTQVQTTARYAHLAADPVKAAASSVSSNIFDSLNGGTI
ncbi:MAG: tyrosine-type recombinase/integrase [Thalassospira sp.]|uniref:site-specific integrase n=1 Tax=Thalassospira sp. TaxID=1912094 RepID=UPI001B1D3EFE|nr:site-specific integrase [Thalassospira sp.]MBO6824467.1 tyrosine-type recombinase/integrase [Pseudomonadales bacterium]MBO6842635.1 tyrosine-type recombinase/integrase [Thalassospira sp.]